LKFQDKRCGKLVIVSHCVLNQNSRVLGLAHYPAVIDEVVDILRRYNIGFLQIPCPELTYAGAKRPGKTREEYNTPSYRSHCRQIATSTVSQLEEFVKNNIRLIVVLGIKNSPSCGIGNLPGETGILIEELEAELKNKGLKIPMHALNTREIAADIEWLMEILGMV